MKVVRLENLFGENYYTHPFIEDHVLEINGVRYLPFKFVLKCGYFYEDDDDEEVEV